MESYGCARCRRVELLEALVGAAASAFAAIAATRRADGRPAALADAQMAAIARSRGMAVATRNTGDFTGMGVDLLDPWTDD